MKYIIFLIDFFYMPLFLASDYDCYSSHPHQKYEKNTDNNPDPSHDTENQTQTNIRSISPDENENNQENPHTRIPLALTILSAREKETERVGGASRP